MKVLIFTKVLIASINLLTVKEKCRSQQEIALHFSLPFWRELSLAVWKSLTL